MNILMNQLTFDTKNMLCCCWFKEFMKIWDLKFVNPVDEQLTILGLGFKWDFKKDLTPLFLTWFSSKAYDPYMHSGYNLDSGINVGPMFIIFVFFPGPTVIKFSVKNQNFIRNTSNFCQIFHALQLLKAFTFILFAKFSRAYYFLPYLRRFRSLEYLCM